jgi:prephenate dehydrogenase
MAAMFEQLGLIGCGLMGGSFALALKRAGLVKRVVGYSKSPSTTERARQMGVIDVEAPSALLAVSGADIVLLAVPVSATEATFKAIRHLITPNMLIMDVGSTKRDVVDAARRVLRDNVGSFVPCHPIAGKEVSGVEHADADLYIGKQVILTPIERTQVGHLKRASTSGKAWAATCSRWRRSARRRLCRRQPPAAPDRLRADARHHQPAHGQGLPGAGRPGLSRLHAHRRQRPEDVARRPAGQPHELLEQAKMFQRSLLNMLQLVKTATREAGRHDRAGQQDCAPTGAWAKKASKRPARRPRHPCSRPHSWTSRRWRKPAAPSRCPAPRAFPTACCCWRRCATATTVVHDLLDSDDTRVMLDALRALGCSVVHDGQGHREHRPSFGGLGGAAVGAGAAACSWATPARPCAP